MINRELGIEKRLRGPGWYATYINANFSSFKGEYLNSKFCERFREEFLLKESKDWNWSVVLALDGSQIYWKIVYNQLCTNVPLYALFQFFLLLIFCIIVPFFLTISVYFSIPAGIYLFKVNIVNTRTVWEICSKLITTSPEQRHHDVMTSFECLYCLLWTDFTHCSGASIVDFSQAMSTEMLA